MHRLSLLRIASVPTHLEQDIALAGDVDKLLTAWMARVGEVFTVVDPDGHFFRARLLADACRVPCRVRVIEGISSGVEPPHWRQLCPAVPSRERMIWIIQKAVELGVTEIQPLLTDRANTVIRGAPRQDKSTTWSRVALRAARQCRRAIIPVVHEPVPLDVYLRCKRVAQFRFFLDTLGEREILIHWKERLPLGSVAVLSGPEGGWTQRERLLLQEEGVVPTTLGDRLLRTETAALAALAVVMMADSAFTCFT